MKEAIWEETHGLNAVLGTKDPGVLTASNGQADMFTGRESAEMRVDFSALRALLQSEFAGQRIEYETLQNQAATGHTFDMVTETHIKRALEELANRRAINPLRSGLPSSRALQRGDLLEFPTQ